MNFKKCDMLSPSITLHFKGNSIHPSIFSGIFTIISFTLIFSYGVYYTVGFIKKVNPTIYFFTRYIEDAGNFPLNSSSLFHFIKLSQTNDNLGNNNYNISMNFDLIRIIGIEYTIDNYISDNNLTNYNHWLYESCSIDDIKNINNIITIEFLENAACIKKYYDSKQQKYFNINEKDFIWPALMYGASNNKRKNYGIIMEKCRNDTINKNCKSENEIKKYLEHSYACLYFIDQYVDVLNYKTPFIKYLHKFTNSFSPNSFTINHLNFNPSLVISHNGIFSDSKISENSYQYILNEKITMEQNNTQIIASFYFWLQNTMQNYERNYQKFQDLISDIGGLGSFISIIATFINKFVTNYIILLDTEELVLNSDKQNFKKVKFNLKPEILKRASLVMNPPKSGNKSIIINSNNSNNNLDNNKQQSSLFQILLKNRIDICKISNNEAISEPFQNYNLKKNISLSLSENYWNKKYAKLKKENNSITKYNYNKENNKRLNSENSSVDSKSNTIKDSVNEIITESKGKGYKPITKQNFTWFNYIWYALSCKSNNPKINYYESFRTKVISEENLIQNHFNVFKLLSLCKIENLDPFKVENVDTNIC